MCTHPTTARMHLIENAFGRNFFFYSCHTSSIFLFLYHIHIRVVGVLLVWSELSCSFCKTLMKCKTFEKRFGWYFSLVKKSGRDELEFCVCTSSCQRIGWLLTLHSDDSCYLQENMNSKKQKRKSHF